MSRRRAILTDRERELISDTEIGDQRYVAVSRVRTKIQEELAEDASILREHHPDLYEELLDVVCGDRETPTAVPEPTPSSEPGPESTQTEAAQPTETTPTADRGREPPRPADIADGDVVVFLDEVDFPESVDRADCVAAVEAAHAYLQREGSATMREIVADVMPEYPAGYPRGAVEDAIEKIESGDRYRGAWWRRVVRPGLEALPDISKPRTGASDWRFTGDGDV